MTDPLAYGEGLGGAEAQAREEEEADTIEVEDAQTPDAPPLWRDSDDEGWMSDGSIYLELVDAPYVTVGVSRGGSVLVDDDSETVAVEPKHLPALIAMLQEVQRRIGGEAA